MTYKVEYESILSRELHVTIQDITDMPIVIHDPMITEVHQLQGMEMFDLIGADSEKRLIITPPEAQANDWVWETFNNGIAFRGTKNPMVEKFDMEFWLG